MGIRGKLVYCLLAVLIPLCSVSTFAFHVFDEELRQRTETALANIQRLEALRISEILEGYAQDARGLAADPSAREYATGIDSYFTAMENDLVNALKSPPAIGRNDRLTVIDIEATWPLQQLALNLQTKAGTTNSSVAEIKIVSRTGKTLGETLGFSWQPVDSTLLDSAMTSVNTIFGDAFLTDSEEQRIGVISPVVSNAGEVVGALLLETPLGPITDIVSMHEQTGLTTEALIAQQTLNGDAQLITTLRYDRKSAFSKTIPASKNLPTNQSLHTPHSRIIEASDYRGINSISSIQTIAATGWGLVVKIDEQEAYAPINALREILAVTVTISLLLILAGYTNFLGPIAQRLHRTAHAAHKITNGDLTIRICDYKNDEIGNMARTINSLAHQLDQDNRKRQTIEDQLRHQATHDELTGLLNRTHANKLIEELNAKLTQSHTVIFLDLNGFKEVNDFYGHVAGDEVLISVAKRLLQVVPTNATLARWGGDEFVIILPQTEQITAQILSSSIHAAFDTLISTSEGSHEITTSIGLATSKLGKSIQEALIEADALMYEEKKKLKSSRSINSMAARTVERALLENRIEIWYEPVVECDTSGHEKLYAADVKIRIRTSEGGIALPEELLNDIGNTPLAAALYQNALSTCVKSITRWIESKIVSPDFKVHFELNPDVLANQKFMDTTLQFFRTKGKSVASHIYLNVNSISHIEHGAIKQLKSTGLGIASNYTGFLTSSIKQEEGYHPDTTKINIQFFDDDILAPNLIADFGKHNVCMCVSSVKTREELARLAAFGTIFFQGTLFDGPLRAVDFVSRWGQPSVSSLIPLTNSNFRLRLAG